MEDEEVSKELARVFRKRGINFHTGAKVDKVEKTKTGIAVTITVDGKQQKIEAEKILIAVGRKPRTENIGLERTKIKPDRGFIKTDSWMQTAEPGVYAIGDIVLGTPQLAHVGAMEAIVAVAKIAGKPGKPINPEHIPGATYCHPEIGSVGLTEAKAREAGYNVKVGKFPFTANSRASIVGQHEGFIKIVSDADYGEILGVHIIGPQATELIAEAVTAMELEATVEDLMWTIHAHPTLAEAMLDASNSVYTESRLTRNSPRRHGEKLTPVILSEAKDLCNSSVSSVSSVVKGFDLDPRRPWQNEFDLRRPTRHRRLRHRPAPAAAASSPAQRRKDRRRPAPARTLASYHARPQRESRRT